MSEVVLPKSLWDKIFEAESGSNVSAKLLRLHQEDKPVQVEADGANYEITVKRASEIGDNFASDVYRITISNKVAGTETSTFAKVLPSQRAFRNVARMGKTHDREIQVYHDLLPLYFDLIQGLEGICLKVPKMYYSRLDETVELPELGDRSPFEFMLEFLPEDGSERILVVEDLKPAGFVMLPKAQGHCLATVKSTLQALAHWHAIGISILKKGGSPPPGMPIFLEKTIYDQNGVMYQEFMDVQKTVLERIGQPELAAKLVQLSKNIGDSLGKSEPGTQGALETIIHGDFWNNNIMYKLSDDGKVDDLVMIDFQIARLGHPCDDLGFYLYGNTTADFRKQHLPEVLHGYYTEVRDVLLKLGHDLEKDGYSETEFLKEWNDRLLRMYIFGCIVTASVTSKKEDVKDSLDKGENLIDQLAQMLASIPDEEQREVMKKQIQEKGKEDSFMSNPDLLVKNEVFIGRFLGLTIEIFSKFQN